MIKESEPTQPIWDVDTSHEILTALQTRRSKERDSTYVGNSARTSTIIKVDSSPVIVEPQVAPQTPGSIYSKLKSILKTEPGLSSKSKRKRDLKFDSKTKNFDGKRTPDVLAVVPFPYDSSRHQKTKQTTKRLEKNLESLFTCPQNDTVLKEITKRQFRNVDELNAVVEKLNWQFGSDTYCYHWRTGLKYLYIKCKSAGCPYSIWFSYRVSETSGEPVNIQWARNVYKSHCMESHLKGHRLTEYL